ncbi:hypothetical protein [Brucella anthropi]|uniref:hypothetical protein n=1 Tax=Brucella anthropi TaxID=529 RepID=UPI00124D65A0|nr:hypothetical protein [Brucella anthropi]KAB2726469.1 hypothetical protein F9K76_07115 [Brucella anthropi]KAB2743631.1 hypothetical protein F9K74_07060 [Brucella anthropi]KAB2804378.1 hypothetical protein F9K83_07060 [Brucella anthropi]
MRQFVLIAASAALLSFSIPGSAAAQSAAETNQALDALFGSHAPYQQFFEKLQKAIAASDKQGVASLVDYPFRARIGGRAVKITDAAHFLADYDKIITAKVKQAILKQTYPTLFANWQGVMIGDGEVWFSGVGNSNTIRITAIND